MGAISYPGRTVEIANATAVLPVRNANSHSLPDSFRWSVLVVGFMAVLLFMFTVELAVYQLVDAGSRVAGKLYHRAVIAYQDFERPSLAEQPDQPFPHAIASPKSELAGHSGHLTKEKMALKCIQDPHGCN